MSSGPRQTRQFESRDERWIARLQPWVESTDAGTMGSSTRSLEPGIWFESQRGECRFLSITEPEEIPSATQFTLLSGQQLGRLLERAVVK